MARLDIEMVISIDFNINSFYDASDYIEQLKNDIESNFADDNCEIFIREYYLEEENDNGD